MGEQSGDDEVVDVAVCPKCSIMTEHTILKKAAKGKGEDLLVRCQECSEVHILNLRPSTLDLSCSMFPGIRAFLGSSICRRLCPGPTAIVGSQRRRYLDVNKSSANENFSIDVRAGLCEIQW